MADENPDTDVSGATRVFDEHRNLLFAVAYRILGSVADAEDVVQEAWLRWVNAPPSEVADPRAFLVRVSSRLAIDRLRRVKARRESYVGPWLPEPVLTGHDVAEDVALAESVSMAMLIVLETLSPLERAVFVLREAFGMPHAEIAEVLGRKEAAVRQLARRAREHVRERSTRFETDQATRLRVTERFLEATTGGNLEALMGVLAIATEAQMTRFLRSIGTEPPGDVRVGLARVNGGPGIVVTSGGTPIAAIVLDALDGIVHTVHLVANPDKLLGVSAFESS
jgi:RNA polymerase sigma factor (sigma-70 family)